jgi:hypothetical protein
MSHSYHVNVEGGFQQSVHQAWAEVESGLDNVGQTGRLIHQVRDLTLH